MNQLLIKHRLAFSSLALGLTSLFLFNPSLPNQWGVLIALILFFSLGIPHGALDYALGRHIFKPYGGCFWQLPFLGTYLLAIVLVLFCWFLFPFISFLFFLVISVVHFGFSDIDIKKGWGYFIEGSARGILPLAAPAYFYPLNFQHLVQSSLSASEAALITLFLSSLLIPCLLLFCLSIVLELRNKTPSSLANILELSALIVLFTALTPFTAFLIYFCFLHSIRHILNVMNELGLPCTIKSINWIIIQALPTTLLTFLILSLCYYCLENETLMNLFFVSLAALTFPHMLLIAYLKFSTYQKKAT